MRPLAQGVDAGVRAAGPGDPGKSARSLFDGLFQFVLDAGPVVLILPAAIGRAVVADSQQNPFRFYRLQRSVTEVWSVKRGEGRGECGVFRVECGVFRVESVVYIVFSFSLLTLHSMLSTLHSSLKTLQSKL